MKTKLVFFLAVFPFSLFLMEWLVRWLVDDKDSQTFIGPAIASAALGLIAPVAVPKEERDSSRPWQRSDHDKNACFAGVLGIGFGFFCWCFCLALSLKHNLPNSMLAYMTVQSWQFFVAMTLYVVGILLTMYKESV